MFKNFSSNTERVNFLLSFSNIASSVMFQEADIQSIKFKFDENTEIPTNAEKVSELCYRATFREWADTLGRSFFCSTDY